MTGKLPVRDFESYLLSVQLLKQRRLIVEGIDDWDVMDTLMKELKRAQLIPELIPIDSADHFDSPAGSGLGNRQRVEALCERLGSMPESSYVVGFVDREYRGFSFDNGVHDNLCCHRVVKQLMWSRGHSIENYFFDFQVFSETMSYYSRARERDAALSLLQDSFPSVIRTACALGLAGHDHEKIDTVRSTVRWQEMVLTPRCAVDNTKWLKHVSARHPKLDWSKIHATFEKHLTELESCDDETVRWLCDGHLGVAFILAAYQRAVYEASGNDSAAADNAIVIKRNNFVPCGALVWSKRACAGEVTWPAELPSLLTA